MFLARIEGTVVAAAQASRRWMDAGFWLRGGWRPTEPRPQSRVVVDWMGAAHGATVMVSTDGDIAREKLGNNTPARMVVVGIVDAVQQPVAAGSDGMRLGIVRGHLTLTPAVESFAARRSRFWSR